MPPLPLPGSRGNFFYGVLMAVQNKIKPRFLWTLIWLIAALVLVWYVVLQREPKKQLESLLIDDTLYASEIKRTADKHGLPPQLVRALIRKESGFDYRAKGNAGEIGLMQILPRGAVADWARINKKRTPSTMELYNVELNLEIGCWYLARALNKWKNYRYAYELALAEYNAGGKNTARWKPDSVNGDVISRIDFPQTRNYVQEIMGHYRRYCAESK